MAFRVDHEDFSSREYSGQRRRKHTMRYFGERFSGRRSKGDGGASMLAKMSLCALMCALVLGVNQLGGGQAVLKAASALGAEAEEIGEEYLGKLRFVQLPGIIEVFSPSAKMRIGCSFTNSSLQQDGTLLAIEGASGQVAAPAGGTIKAVAEEEGRDCLDVAMQDDVTVRYYGLVGATVEEGQRVAAGDTLGNADGTLRISVWHEGRPQDPSEYFDAAFSGA